MGAVNRAPTTARMAQPVARPLAGPLGQVLSEADEPMHQHGRFGGLLLLAAALAVVLAGCGGGAARYNRQTVCMTGEELQSQQAWLASEVSAAWRQQADLAQGRVPTYADLGCYALGNGHVFTTLGLHYPFGAMANIFGPTYQKSGRQLGRITPVVVADGKPLLLAEQQTEWVLRAGVVHTRLAEAQGLALDLYDLVPPDVDAIVRVLVASNAAQGRRVRVGLSFELAGLAAEGKCLTMSGQGAAVRCGIVGAEPELVTGDRCHDVEMPLPPEAAKAGGAQARPEAAALLCDLGKLGPGESAAKVFYMAVAPDAQAAAKTADQVATQAFGLLQATRDWWQRWYADALKLECPEAALSDLLTLQQYLCRIQQARPGGGYSPMYHYSTCWVRDSNGPVRLMTLSGKASEVRDYLEYYYRCSARAGKITLNAPLNVDVTGPVPQVDWARVPVDRAEVPSFLILQHYWYWEHTGDLEPINAHWPYLRRCLTGQEMDAAGRLPFHGDETYRFPGYNIFSQTRSEPTDWVSMELRSLDSSLEYLAACRAMKRFATLLGRTGEVAECEALERKVREGLAAFQQPGRGFPAPALSDLTGQQHEAPFANINASLAWLRPAPVGAEVTPRPEPTFAAVLPYLVKTPAKPGQAASPTPKTTPQCGYYVGMTPGQALYAVPCRKLLDAVVAAASPAGEYAEMLQPDDRCADRYWGKNRIRPWEGGINLEAVVWALAGYAPHAAERRCTLQPLLPAGWGSFALQHLRLGSSAFSVRCERAGRKLTVTWEAGEAVRVETPGASGGGRAVTVDAQHPAATLEGVVGDLPPGPPASQARPFHWSAPDIGAAKVVLYTWDRQTAAEQRARYGEGLYVVDSRIAWPAEWLRAVLLRPDGSRRAERLILDVALFPGSFKAPDFWSAGMGKRIADAFASQGGVVEQLPVSRQRPSDAWGL